MSKKYRKRIYYTKEQQALMWDQWQRGESLHDVTRLFDRYHTSVGGIIARAGGIRKKPRTRFSLSLTLYEKETISRRIAADLPIRTNANQLGRAPSTIYREINRNGGYYNYRTAEADEAT